MFLDHFCWIINVSFIKRLSELMCVELKMFNILFGFWEIDAELYEHWLQTRDIIVVWS